MKIVVFQVGALAWAGLAVIAALFDGRPSMIAGLFVVAVLAQIVTWGSGTTKRTS